MPHPASEPNPKGNRLAIALGDPAGIGAEVVLKALADWPAEQPSPLLVGCRRWLKQRHTDLQRCCGEPLADPDALELLDLPLPQSIRAGEAGAASGDASFHWLTQAVAAVQSGRCRAP